MFWHVVHGVRGGEFVGHCAASLALRRRDTHCNASNGSREERVHAHAKRDIRRVLFCPSSPALLSSARPSYFFFFFFSTTSCSSSNSSSRPASRLRVDDAAQIVQPCFGASGAAVAGRVREILRGVLASCKSGARWKVVRDVKTESERLLMMLESGNERPNRWNFNCSATSESRRCGAGM